MKLEALGEFGLIRRILPHFPSPPEGQVGIGDDCAVLRQGNGEVLLVSTDLLLENSHFLLDRMRPEDLGYKALAVNLSDIAAMGGRPTGALLSLGLPKGLEVEWLDGFFAGMKELVESAGCPLLGGDTTRSRGGMVINVAVLGVARADEVKLRSGARPGDVIAVTGVLGDSGNGLNLLLEDLPREQADRKRLVEAHVRPRPHLEEGMWLGKRAEVGGMMDVSDGIDSDLRRMMEQAGVGMRVDLDRLPVSEELVRVSGSLGWNVRDLAATAGEDYCLVCTVAEGGFSKVAADFEARFGRRLTAIGRVEEGGELGYRWRGWDTQLAVHGFDHFRENGS
ncbi:MAG TPA: thiamine-phosphate kinase [Kiritimatiellia bacterium]|nr:thiamine-phosphate kinase [Kiritimatiellia bacterium]